MFEIRKDMVSFFWRKPYREGKESIHCGLYFFEEWSEDVIESTAEEFQFGYQSRFVAFLFYFRAE